MEALPDQLLHTADERVVGYGILDAFQGEVMFVEVAVDLLQGQRGHAVVGEAPEAGAQFVQVLMRDLIDVEREVVAAGGQCLGG